MICLNLITSGWIPVLRRDGCTDTVAPWQITDQHDSNPIMDVASPRPDFDGALVQFLIGLYQTVMPPRDECQWRDALTSPPSPDEMRAALTPFAPAFSIGGDGPQFMQERHIEEKKIWAIRDLLIGSPESTKIENNTDHFQKRGTIAGLCPRCAALALYTLQINAPSGGQGHMTSIRGGGPMTTLALGKTLWQTVWANIFDLEGQPFAVDSPPSPDDPRLFPWMGKPWTSRGGKATEPEDMHIYHVFWGMPRRILLNLHDAKPGACDLCGGHTPHMVTTYWSKPYGYQYAAGWSHPLTPYYRNSKSSTELLPVHPQPRGITYLDWMGLVINDGDMACVSPNVALIRQRARDPFVQEILGGRPLIWAFGHDMKNKKPRCWYEGTMPVILAEEEWQESFDETAAGMVRAAENTADNLQWCVKVALFDEPEKVKGDMSVISARFLQATEGAFYRSLDKVATALSHGDDTEPVRREWLDTLQTASTPLFREYSQIDSFSAINTRRAVSAWSLLTAPALKSNKATRDALGLSDQKNPANGGKQ